MNKYHGYDVEDENKRHGSDSSKKATQNASTKIAGTDVPVLAFLEYHNGNNQYRYRYTWSSPRYFQAFE